MMSRMGLGMSEIPDAQQVIIQTSTKEIIIENPDVAVLEMRGQKIFQVTGEKITEKAVKKETAFPEEDIRLVADQTGKSMDEAKKALEETGGDLAKAILLLQTKV
jgi:nascent polypeptide-associated complex subunit alpha